MPKQRYNETTGKSHKYNYYVFTECKTEYVIGRVIDLSV